MPKYLLIPLMVIALMGAGCLDQSDRGNDVSTGNQGNIPSSNEDNNGGVVRADECVDGMERFTHAGSGFTFCYPDDMTVSATGTTDVTVLVEDEDGEVVREMRVLPRPDDQDEEEIVLSYAASPDGIECDVLKDSFDHMDAYSLVGSPEDGDQSLESVTACRNTTQYTDALTELPLELFLFDKDEDDFYVLLNGEQDAAFGSDTEAFQESLDIVDEDDDGLFDDDEEDDLGNSMSGNTSGNSNAY